MPLTSLWTTCECTFIEILTSLVEPAETLIYKNKLNFSNLYGNPTCTAMESTTPSTYWVPNYTNFRVHIYTYQVFQEFTFIISVEQI